jgi:hypothetical protein
MAFPELERMPLRLHESKSAPRQPKHEPARGEGGAERRIEPSPKSTGVEFVAEHGGGAGVRLRKGVTVENKAASNPIADLNAEDDE